MVIIIARLTMQHIAHGQIKSNVSEKIKDSYIIAAIQAYNSTGCWAQENDVLTPNVG